MKHRSAAALLLLLCILPVATALRPAAVTAQDADAAGAAVVQAAYDDLLSLFYRPVQPSALLEAGWGALTRAAVQAGFTPPPPLPNLPESQAPAFSTFNAAYDAYLRSLPPAASPGNLGFAMATGMAASLDENHTHFLTPAGYRSFLASLGSGELPAGFGIRTNGAAPWVITAVAPNGPAAAAGILPGDLIVSSDGTDLTNASGQDFARATGGQAGTSHALVVEREGTQIAVTVSRGSFYFPPLSSRLLPGAVGYLLLEHFPDAGLTLPDGTEIISEFDRQLEQLESGGATGLILDLRGNGGGDTLAAEEILGRLLPPDEKTVLRFDERGHAATGVVAGPMRPRQLPLVVLVDGDSASSSELVASTLREADRAILVGQRTAGALATSEILPLPQAAGIQIAVAEQVTDRTGFQIDGAGFPVDIDVPDSRTPADFQAGRDPQLQAAVQALSEAPDPPMVVSTTGVSKAQIGALLSRYMPDPTRFPTNDRLTGVVRTETLDLNQPNEWLDTFGFGGRDPLALQRTLVRRGWIGSHVQNYNLQPLVPPTVSVVIDLYASAAGAEEALRTNDFPDQQTFIPAPVQLGDGAMAARGIWLDLGGISLSWRRGNAVLSIGYGDAPGFERTDVMIAVARLVDQAVMSDPLPLLNPPSATQAGPAAKLAGSAKNTTRAPAPRPALSYSTATAVASPERKLSSIIAGQTRSNWARASREKPRSSLMAG